jgi:hypothetical protein
MSMVDGYYDSGMFLETSAPVLAVSAISSVPEPTAWLMGLVGAMGCVGWARSLRRSA